MNTVRTFFIFLILFLAIGFSSNKLKAQDPLKDLRVIGNFIQFNYSTLNHFNNGIELTDWTRVRIRFKYTGTNGWELRIFALSNKIHFEGNSTYDIELEDLEIIPNIISSNDASASINIDFTLGQGPYNPSIPDQVLVSGNEGTVLEDPPVEIEIVITYRLGPMMNKPEGIYFVNLNMLLVEK
jgi:hypothetical protein